MEGAEQLYDLLDNVNDLIQSVAPDGSLLYVNRAWRETLGYDESEVTRLNIFDVVHPDSCAHCAKLFQSVMQGAKLDRVEAVFVAKNGRRIVVEGSANCQMKDGQPVATRAIFRDVTQRKGFEEELQRREEELRTLLEHSPDVVSRFDRNLRYTYVNATIERITGVSAPFFLGKTNTEAGMPPDVVTAWEAKLRVVFEGAVSEKIEFAFPTPQGTRDFDSILVPELGPDGKVESVLVLSRDVTDHKRAEEALHESEARFHSFMDNTPILAYIKDEDGRLIYVNQPLLCRFDKRPDEMLGKTDFEIWPPDVAGPLREHDKIILDGDTPITLEETASTPDGQSDTWLSFKFPLRNPKGGKFLAGMSVDITDRKYYERQLEEYQGRLETAIAELERLSSTDALSGLKNKGAFTQRLEEEIARAKRYHLPLSLLLLDIDKFKEYNDSFGHPAGDEVLKQAAGLLQQHARPSDFVARVGGEEFAVILSNTPAQGAFIVAERLRRSVESALWTKRRVTVSIGIAEVSEANSDSASLVEATDRALYQAKRNGRNQVAQGC